MTRSKLSNYSTEKEPVELGMLLTLSVQLWPSSANQGEQRKVLGHQTLLLVCERTRWEFTGWVNTGTAASAEPACSAVAQTALTAASLATTPSTVCPQNSFKIQNKLLYFWQVTNKMNNVPSRGCPISPSSGQPGREEQALVPREPQHSSLPSIAALAVAHVAAAAAHSSVLASTAAGRAAEAGPALTLPGTAGRPGAAAVTGPGAARGRQQPQPAGTGLGWQQPALENKGSLRSPVHARAIPGWKGQSCSPSQQLTPD